MNRIVRPLACAALASVLTIVSPEASEAQRRVAPDSLRTIQESSRSTDRGAPR